MSKTKSRPNPNTIYKDDGKEEGCKIEFKGKDTEGSKEEKKGRLLIAVGIKTSSLDVLGL